MSNKDVALTLDECVAEVLGILTDLDLTYRPELDRYRVITRKLNQALRANALEHEWSYYSDLEQVGTCQPGESQVPMKASLRPRIINDDAVRLVDQEGHVHQWAYFLARDALHKYPFTDSLHVAHTRSTLEFSRPFGQHERGLLIEVPVMREPRMFRLPAPPEDPDEPTPEVPRDVRDQLLDFDFPDVVTMRAAYLYCLTDPVAQPRAQTYEAMYKDLMYGLIERDDRNTDSPYLNPVILPIDSDLSGRGRVHEFPTVFEGYRN